MTIFVLRLRRNKNRISVALIVDIVLQSFLGPNPLEFGAIFAQIPLDLNPFFSLIIIIQRGLDQQKPLC